MPGKKIHMGRSHQRRGIICGEGYVLKKVTPKEKQWKKKRNFNLNSAHEFLPSRACQIPFKPRIYRDRVLTPGSTARCASYNYLDNQTICLCSDYSTVQQPNVCDARQADVQPSGRSQ